MAKLDLDLISLMEQHASLDELDENGKLKDSEEDHED